MAVAVIRLTAAGERAIARAGARGSRLAAEIPVAVNAGGLLMVGAIQANEFGPGKAIGIITDMLRSSIAHRVEPIAGGVAVFVGVTKGPASAYARIQYLGGTIRAKAGGALAIPLPAALTGGKRPRYPLGPRDPKVAQHFPGGTFIHKKPGKPPVIYGLRTVAGGGSRVAKPTPLFVLVKSVKVKPHDYLAVRKHLVVLRTEVQRRLDAVLEAE